MSNIFEVPLPLIAVILPLVGLGYVIFEIVQTIKAEGKLVSKFDKKKLDKGDTVTPANTNTQDNGNTQDTLLLRVQRGSASQQEVDTLADRITQQLNEASDLSQRDKARIERLIYQSSVKGRANYINKLLAKSEKSSAPRSSSPPLNA